MLYWQPMTNEDWEWVNYGTPPKKEEPTDSKESQ